MQVPFPLGWACKYVDLLDQSVLQCGDLGAQQLLVVAQLGDGVTELLPCLKGDHLGGPRRKPRQDASPLRRAREELAERQAQGGRCLKQVCNRLLAELVADLHLRGEGLDRRFNGRNFVTQKGNICCQGVHKVLSCLGMLPQSRVYCKPRAKHTVPTQLPKGRRSRSLNAGHLALFAVPSTSNCNRTWPRCHNGAPKRGCKLRRRRRRARRVVPGANHETQIKHCWQQSLGLTKTSRHQSARADNYRL